MSQVDNQTTNRAVATVAIRSPSLKSQVFKSPILFNPPWKLGLARRQAKWVPNLLNFLGPRRKTRRGMRVRRGRSRKLKLDLEEDHKYFYGLASWVSLISCIDHINSIETRVDQKGRWDFERILTDVISEPLLNILSLAIFHSNLSYRKHYFNDNQTIHMPVP